MAESNNFTLDRAKNALVSHDFALAARLYNSALAKNPDDVQILLALGSCYEKAKMDKKAQEPYLRILNIQPFNFEALNALGGVYRRLGKYNESVEVLEKALRTHQDDCSVYYNLGSTYKLMGDYDSASECFVEVMDVNPNDVLACNHLGTIQALKGNHTKALQTYWRALQIDSNHPVLHYNSALSYMALGKIEEAKKSMQNALKAKPGWPEALAGYADLLISERNYDDAEEVLSNGLKINPDNPLINTGFGRLCRKTGRFSDSEKYYRQSLSQKEGDITALTGLELLYERQGRSEAALKMLDEIKKASENQETFENTLRRAKLLIDQNNLREAGDVLRPLQNTHGTDSEYLNTLAQYYTRAGRTDKANGCCKKIAEISPENITYLRDCAAQNIRNENYKDAAKQLELYLDMNPGDAKAMELLGNVLESRGNYDEALEMWNKALEIEKNNPILLASVTRVGNRMNNSQSTMARVSEILDRASENLSAEELKESLRMYEQAVVVSSAEVPLAEEDKIADETLGGDIDEIETLDYDRLLQLEVTSGDVPDYDDEYREMLVEPVENIRSVDDERLQRSAMNDMPLLTPDMPMEFNPALARAQNYDPFEGAPAGNYSIGEKQDFMSVDGMDFEDDEDQIQYQNLKDDKPAPQAEPYMQPIQPQPVRQAPPQMPPAWYSQPEPSPVPAPEPAEKPAPQPQPVFRKEPELSSPEMPLDADDQIPAEPEENFAEDALFDQDLTEDLPEEIVLANDDEPDDEAENESDNVLSADDTENDGLSSLDSDAENEESYGDTEELFSDEDGTDGSAENAFETDASDADDVVDTEDAEDLTDAGEPVFDEPVMFDADSDLSMLPQSEPEPVDFEPVTEEALDLPEDYSPAEEENAAGPENEPPYKTAPQEDDLSRVKISSNPDAEKATIETVSNVVKRVMYMPTRKSYKNTADMFQDLRSLCSWLPPEAKDKFMHSLARLKLDYVISRLNGRPGLLAAAQALRKTGGMTSPASDVKTGSLLKTMSYMQTLTGALPDKVQGDLLGSEVSRIAEALEKANPDLPRT